MPTAIQLVTDFFESWSGGRAPMFSSFHDYFSADAVWENVGISVTTGPDEAVASFGEALGTTGFDYMEVEILHIVAAGNVVMTERLDYFVRPGGERIEPVRVMGVMEIEGNRISAWRDYLDPRPFLALVTH